MKLISQHMGEILVVLIGIAILLAVCVTFQPELKAFFSSIMTSLQGAGTKILNQINAIDFAGVGPALGA